ncbi:serine/threonine-protein kinase WAG1-like [Vicia villosa]|uniref:serine/threonine-protein kinase WAG1-like n=1 Tax=Vicia villosa TaxID=3911 RepID=UPI00273CC0C1|nr:serine/threonine-protein kinase WAG1-like [Vicia villosa]
MEEPTFLFPPPDSDLDLSFTSTTTDRTFTSSSARTSLARTSSLALSFNDRLSTASAAAGATLSSSITRRPHRSSDPNWTAIKAATNLSSDGRLHLRHIKLLRHLGSGDLGRVYLCRLRDYDGANFALKVVDKDLLTLKKSTHAETEAEILHMLDHPFLPTLYARIDVSHYSCLLIDYCPGGDLHSLLRKQPGNRFTLSAARFFAAEILVALEYLHALGVVYRDLKPENVLLREDGHVMLSDFDLCFKADVAPTFEFAANHKPHMDPTYSCFSYNISQSKSRVTAEFVAEPTAAFSRSCVGTHEYLAPELVSGYGHGNGVDWWAFGVFIYELLYGTTPFKGCNKESTLRNIASNADVKFNVAENEEVGMIEARDLIAKLLVKDPRRRLGCARGATDIKRHPFFDGIKWPLIRNYKAPEVKGLLRRKKSDSSLSCGSSKRKRGWWKRLGGVLRNKGGRFELLSNCSNNNSYYCYVNNSNKVR